MCAIAACAQRSAVLPLCSARGMRLLTRRAPCTDALLTGCAAQVGFIDLKGHVEVVFVSWVCAAAQWANAVEAHKVLYTHKSPLVVSDAAGAVR